MYLADLVIANSWQVVDFASKSNMQGGLNNFVANCICMSIRSEKVAEFGTYQIVHLWNDQLLL